MPKFRVRSPQGQTIEVNADNQEQAIAIAQGMAQVQSNTSGFQQMARNSRPGPPDRRGPSLSQYAQREITGREQGRGPMVALGGTGDSLAGQLDQVVEFSPLGNALNSVGLGALIPRPGSALMDVADPSGSRAPRTESERWLRTGGAMAPAAMMPGSALSRVLNVVVPTVAAEGSADAVRALGGDENAQETARVVGGVAGGAVAGVRPRPGPPIGTRGQSPNTRGIRMATKGLSPDKLREGAARLRQHGFEPTLTDVVDESGRAVIRDANSRMTPGRTAAQVRADSVMANAPGQAAQRVGQLTPDQPGPLPEIRGAAVASRRAQGARDYAAAANDRVAIDPVAPELAYQREAVAAAARTLRTNKAYDQASELDAVLARMDRGEPLTGDISTGALDQVKRELMLNARNAIASTNRTSEGPGLTERGTNVDNYLAEQSDAYRTARDNYARNKQVEAGLEQGNILGMTGPEGVSAIRNMTEAQRAGARVAVRQKLQDMFTGATSADGPLRRLQLEDDVRAILTELYGPEEAASLADYAKVARERINAARYVAPNTGSQTALRQADSSAVANMADTGLELATGGKLTLIRKAIDLLRPKGLGDADAQLLAEAAADPARLDAIIADIERRQPQIGQQLRAALPRAGAVAAVAAPGLQDRRNRPGPPQ